VFFFQLDKILHNNEASSNTTQSTIRDRSMNENDQERASLGCNYMILIQYI